MTANCGQRGFFLTKKNRHVIELTTAARPYVVYNYRHSVFLRSRLGGNRFGGTMREIVPGVFVAERPMRFYGIEVGTRMTVLQLGERLLVHSPIDLDPTALEHLGQPGFVLAPNKLHHCFVGPWAAAGWPVWAAPGLPEKRPDVAFQGIVTDGNHPFGADIEALTLTCFSLTNEVVLFHRPSRTLIVTDFLFHFAADAPFLTRVAMACAGCYPGCKASILERVLMRRKQARIELATILAWPFERIVLAHGTVITENAKSRLALAYRWLGG